MAANEAPVRKSSKRKELRWEERRNLFFTYIMALHGGPLKLGFVNQQAALYQVGRRCVARTWEKLRKKYEQEFGLIDEIDIYTMMRTIPDEFFFTNKKKCGQNSRQYYPEVISEALTMVKAHERQTYHSAARALEIPKTTLWRLIKRDGGGVRHSSQVKPFLKEFGKYKRLVFALQQIDPATITSRGAMKFKDPVDEVHIGELSAGN